MNTQRAMATRRHVSRTPARHSAAQCRRILRTISAYLDHDLPKATCAMIRRHLGACPKCARVVQSLKRTIDLCKKADVARLTAAEKSRLHKEILTAVSRL